MNAFHKLPGHRPSAAGVERAVLRRLPLALLLATLLPAMPSLLARALPWAGSEVELALRISTIDIYAVSVVILLWTVAFTVAIAAFIVMVMKGPAYVADAYPLADADAPGARR